VEVQDGEICLRGRIEGRDSEISSRREKED